MYVPQAYYCAVIRAFGRETSVCVLTPGIDYRDGHLFIETGEVGFRSVPMWDVPMANTDTDTETESN